MVVNVVVVFLGMEIDGFVINFVMRNLVVGFKFIVGLILRVGVVFEMEY